MRVVRSPPESNPFSEATSLPVDNGGFIKVPLIVWHLAHPQGGLPGSEAKQT